MAACLGVADTAQAVVVGGSPATPNTTAPVGYEDAWNRVGILGGGSGVYLGNGYVLSARHVGGGGTFSIDGVSHSRIAGTSITLSNPGGQDLSSSTDLWINRYAVSDSSPLHGLGVLQIRETTPNAGLGPAILIGEGLGQATTTPVSVGPGLTGYAWGDGETRRWGETFVSTAGTFTLSGIDILGYQSTTFNNNENRAMAANGDSGGGLFHIGGSGLELIGITHAVSTETGQNANTAAFGNRTIFSDLSNYLDQINVVEGDLDGDGFVGASDLELLLANWGQPVTAGDWTQGDADGDGLVGETDLDHVLAHYGAGEPPATTVPEPGVGALLAMGLLTCRRRRPRGFVKDRGYFP